MSNTKPQITATIKFRDVTIENMTIEELKALRDVLNELVGDRKEYVPYPQPYPVYPARPWYESPFWVTTSGNTTTSDKITLGSTGGALGVSDDAQHYTISCAN